MRVRVDEARQDRVVRTSRSIGVPGGIVASTASAGPAV
jgi:hypothetical protein